MRLIILLFSLVFLTLKADSQSIRFSSLSWQQALAQAKSENKMLFVELYTTWCTYCKQMEQNVFPTSDVGIFYNQHFINVRYDALKSDGIQIRRTYAVFGFPMFLYLDNNGIAVLKTDGYQSKEVFARNADSAYTTLQKRNLVSISK